MAGASAAALDQGQLRAMRPAITAYLQSAAYRDRNSGYSPADFRAQHVRWICAAGVIEVRPDGAGWRVGLDAACGDYVRHGDRVLMEDGGDQGHEVMILSARHGRYQVLSAAQEPGISPDPAWIDQNFSALAAAVINNGQAPQPPWPARAVLLAFGCRPAAVRGSVLPDAQGLASGWPCRLATAVRGLR